jgi:carbon monoxide dehydrogenase subunit G
MALEFTSEVRFAVPPERVFRAFEDLDSWGAWMPGFVRVERLGPVKSGVGLRWRETRKMFGREASEVFEVRRCEPGKALGLYIDGKQGATGKGEYHFDYDFVPDGAGSLVRMRARIEMPGFFAKLFGGMFAGMFKKICEKDLTALKAHLEAAR